MIVMRVLLLITALLAGLATAHAASVRGEVHVAGDLVTLGDLVDGAGDKADVAVFRAPDLGKSGVISASRIVEAAARHGLTASADGVGAVTVWRDSRTLSQHEIEDAVRRTLAERGLVGDGTEVEIAVNGLNAPVHLPVSASGRPMVTEFAIDSDGRAFDARVTITDDAGKPAYIVRASGRLTDFVEIPVLARRVDRLETIQPDDLVMKKVEVSDATAAVADTSAIVGQAAVRTLRAGVPIAARDLTAPLIVQRNEIVTMVLRSGRLLLTTKGRALADGAEGDTVSVINNASKRIVEGRVMADGSIEVEVRRSPVSLADASPR